MKKQLYILFILLGMIGCRPRTFTPKPAGYFLIDTPLEHKYQLFDKPNFPYTFEYPVYSIIVKDTLNFAKKDEENQFWVDIVFPDWDGIINVTYKEISKSQSLDRLNNDAYQMSFFHHEKASYMDSREFVNEYGVSGVLYTIGGNVATRYQFTATDSVKHFFRGALYFNVTPNSDSLKPVSDFLAHDIEHLLFSLKWKK